MTREEDSSILRRCDDIGVGLILQDIRTLIESTRAAVAESVNVSLTLLYWRIGERINSEVLGRQRGRYGEEIVSTPSRQLEAAILRELESFLMELGGGFTFVARQKRIVVDQDDFYIDLLFFHRDLRRLVAVELKLDRFRPEHKGQMELYLRWLDKYERKAGEEPPLGIILCSGKDDERVELLELGRAGIHVAEYLTELPSKELLRERLHAAIERSRQRLENRGVE